MDIYESMVAAYLTANGRAFICPQVDFNYVVDGTGGTCPDFLVLDIKKMETMIVEVSSASNVGSLFKKIDDAENR